MAAMYTERIVANNGHVYEVRWNCDDKDVHMVDCGPSWALVTDGATIQVGHASTKAEAVSKCEAAAYNMLSSYDKYVMGTTMGKSHVIGVHLLLEHLMVRCLHVVIPNPDALFGDRTLSFSMLISLCEAHGVVDTNLSRILRMVNAIRNKCAHKLVYHPSDSEVRNMLDALRRRNPDGFSAVEDDDEDDCWKLLCRLLEERAIELGVTDI